MAEFFSNQLRHIGIDHIARLHHLALLHPVLDDVHRTLSHTLCEFLKRNGFRHGHFTRNLLAGFLHLRTLELFLTATHCRQRTRTTFIFQIAGDCQLATTTIVFGLGNLWRTDFRLCRCTATRGTQATATTIIVVTGGSTRLAQLALWKRLVGCWNNIGNRRCCRTCILLRTTTLWRTTRMLRTTTLRCRTGIATLFRTAFRLRHTLVCFRFGTRLGFCFRLQTCFFLCLTASGFFTFLGATCIFFGAALGFFSSANAISSVTNLRFFKRAATCIHFGTRERIQHHAGAIRLAWTLLLAGALLVTRLLLCNMRPRRCYGRRCYRSCRCRCHRSLGLLWCRRRYWCR
ncbi:hypothetical protein D9M69_492570 [compost metagenome]